VGIPDRSPEGLPTAVRGVRSIAGRGKFRPSGIQKGEKSGVKANLRREEAVYGSAPEGATPVKGHDTDYRTAMLDHEGLKGH